MQFGIALPTAADAWKIVRRAEDLGFTHAWFYDTQMLCADCFGALRDSGYTQFTIQLVPGQEHAIEDWARITRKF